MKNKPITTTFLNNKYNYLNNLKSCSNAFKIENKSINKEDLRK